MDRAEPVGAIFGGMATSLSPSNRGFWLVMAPIAIAGVLLIVLIAALRPRPDPATAGVARESLTSALRAAERAAAGEGGYASASFLRLRELEPDLLFVDPDEASNAPRVVSVFASGATWAAAARAEDGTCYFVRSDDGGGRTYGTLADCTGAAASTAEGASGGWT